jgi:hypothetical protein
MSMLASVGIGMDSKVGVGAEVGVADGLQAASTTVDNISARNTVIRRFDIQNFSL